MFSNHKPGNIEDMEDIKLGMQTANFIEVKRLMAIEPDSALSKRAKKLHVDEHHCLSIIFSGQLRTVDLIAPTRATRRKWYHNLRSLIQSASEYQTLKQDFNV